MARSIPRVKKNQYVSFDKFSIQKGKKYKNNFDKKFGLDVVSDEEGKKYLVDADGTIYTMKLKPYDEVGGVEINKL